MSSTRRQTAACLFAWIVAATSTPSLAQTSNNMTLLGSLQDYTQYSDVWGYTDALGREYAIVGTRDGTTIVNVTDPANPYETGFIPGPSSVWRDMKTFGPYAYLVTEGGGGMQIVNLADPENPEELAPYLGFSSAHNIYIEEATGRAYPCGTDSAAGFHVLDLSDPTQPLLLGSYTTTYVHDLFVRDNIAYTAEIYDGTLSILDVTSPNTPVRLAGPIGYPGSFTHNTWLTDDSKYVLTTDEVVGARVRVWDTQSFLDISQVGSYQAPVANSIVHNVTVRGDRAYVAYYTEGVRVVDLSDPTMPTEVGYYDSWSGASGGYDGAWGVYPFLPSGHILVSDIQSGLLILTVGDTGKVLGTVTNSVTGLPLADAQVELIEPGVRTTTSVSGTFSLAEEPGTYTLRASRPGFYDHEESVTLDTCCELTVDIALGPRPSGDLAGTVTGSDPAKALQTLGDARIELLGTIYQATTAADGTFLLPQVPVGSYMMRTIRAGFGSQDVPVDVVESGSVQDVTLDVSPWYDDADADRGWSLADPGDTAIRGLWVRAVPVPSGGGSVQPGQDASPGVSAGICFVTGNGSSPGASVGEEDVDEGTSTLTTPRLDLSGLVDPYLAYSRWYVNAAGANPGTDVFTVQISNDDGGTWKTLETLDFDATPWTRVVFRVQDHLAPTSQMLVRFIADDAGPGSVVEAAIDDLEFWGRNATAVDPTGDLPSPALVPTLDAFPNPFNPTTQLRFELFDPTQVRLDVHDLRGRTITNLVNRELAAGIHAVRWDGRDAAGRAVASGVYLAVLRTVSGERSQKLVLAK